jgi:pyridoxine 5-phosphate synthase
LTGCGGGTFRRSGSFAGSIRSPGIRRVGFAPGIDHGLASREVGAGAIEINTGGYSDASAADRPARLESVRRAAAAAAAQGLEVLAGHGLTYVNVRPIVAIPEIVELNIGHSIIARAALVGLDRAVREMVALLEPR